MSFPRGTSLIQTTLILGAALFGGIPFAAADTFTTTSLTSPRVLQEALAAGDRVSLYDGKTINSGFNVASGFFSGRASGIDPTAISYLDGGSDRTAELEGDQRVYAMMIDGSYDFNRDAGTGHGVHPYLLGGVGMAMYDHGTMPSASTLALQGGDMVPLLRVGGGVAYHLSETLNLSLDYKAGLSSMGGDGAFISHTQQPVDTHVINMGVRYQF